jgi:transposase
MLKLAFCIGYPDCGRMQRYQSYKFELRPTGDQLRWMRRIAGCCRFVLNLALATQKQRVFKGLAELDFKRLCTQLAEWRRLGTPAQRALSVGALRKRIVYLSQNSCAVPADLRKMPSLSGR